MAPCSKHHAWFRRCGGMFIALLCLAGLLLWAPASYANSSEEPLNQIESIAIDSKTGDITLTTSHPLDGYEPFASLKLMNPHRLVVDLPNSQLTGQAKTVLKGQPAATVPINAPHIPEMQVQETSGMFYQSVRFVILTDNHNTLNRLQLAIDGTTIRIHQGAPAAGTTTQPNTPVASVPAQSAMPLGQPSAPPVSASNLSIVTQAHYANGQLLLTTDPQHRPIQLRNQFTLTSPNRLVLDFHPAKLAQKTLAGAISVGNNSHTRAIRIGQFDDDTVRVVIETNTPNRWATYFSRPPFERHNPSHVIISAESGINATQLPAQTALTTLEKIGLDESQSKGALIRLKTKAPLVHRWYQNDNQLIVQMLNVAAEPGNVGFDAEKYPMIKSMTVEKLSPNQPNSQFVITLAEPHLSVQAAMEKDDHILALHIQPKQPLAAVGKLPFKATVVVDAGHGGKDRGTSRAGVYEKDLNLSVAMKLKAALEARGVRVYTTRNTDRYLTLKQITDISNGHRPDAFVSIHHNASTNPAIHGIETYYYHGRSIPLAKTIHARMVATQRRPNRNVRRARFYVINHTNVPAVLCEIGYVSNTAERGMLVRQDTQTSAANAIADGVVEFLLRHKR